MLKTIPLEGVILAITAAASVGAFRGFGRGFAQIQSPAATATQGGFPSPAGKRRGLQPVPKPNLTSLEPVIRQQIREAESKLTSALRNPAARDAELAEAFGKLGEVYQVYDMKDAAIACYFNAQALDAHKFEWPYYLGYLYQLAGESGKAAAAFARALGIRPNAEAALLRAAQTNLDSNHKQVAREEFEKALQQNPTSAAALAGLGKLALAEGDYAAAARAFRRALATDPKASSLHYQLAMAYRGLNDIDHAQEEIEKQGKDQPQFPDPLVDRLEALKRGEAALWQKGTRAIHAGKTAEAVEDFREMVALDPKDATARMYLGIALAQSGDLKGAAEQDRRALALAPGNAGVHYNLGAVLTEQGEEREAIEQFQAAVQADPHLTKAHFQLANLLMRQGRSAEAVGEYGAVIAAEPGNGFARLMQALGLIREKQYAGARAALEQGLAALPHDADLGTTLARLLAACPDAAVRDGQRALAMIERVMQGQPSFDLEQGQTLAMALAAVGQFPQAARVQSMMIAQLESAGRADLARPLRANLELYQHNQPCLTPWRDDDPVFAPVPAKMKLPPQEPERSAMGEPSVR